MCLILFAYQVHPRYRLALAANRDEFYARPTAPLDFWRDHPHVLAGRDLAQKGTWLGVTAAGRLAAITNYRDLRFARTNPPSRGALVADFLLDECTPREYLERIAPQADRYNGFNLIVGDAAKLLYFSNLEGRIRTIEPGIHGLSNHLLDTPWHKVLLGKKRLKDALRAQDLDTDILLRLLEDQLPADTDRLPATGISLEWERILSPMFIISPDYGTRSSSVLLIDHQGCIRFSERTFQPALAPPREQFTRSFELNP